MNSLYTIIGNQLSTPRNLNDDMRLIEDLGMDSLALMNLVLDIEDEYDISFDDGNLLFENFKYVIPTSLYMIFCISENFKLDRIPISIIICIN